MRKIKFSLFITLGAVFLLGNTNSCNAPASSERQLRRRVAMGSVTAQSPSIPIPAAYGGGSFDFQFAANAQLQYSLQNTTTFSVTNNYYDLGQVSSADKQGFYSCNSGSGSQPFDFSNIAPCMINQPTGKIDATVVDFQLLYGVNGNIGLANLSGLTWFGGSFNRAQLTMNFDAYDPLRKGLTAEGWHIAGSQNKQYANNISIDLKGIFSSMTAGLGFYYNSDLAKVVLNSMQAGFADLKSQWDAVESARGAAGGWYAMVLKNCDNGILINGGGSADANLQVGDILKVYNISYQWSGPVCASDLSFAEPFGQPAAYAVIDGVYDTVSTAKILKDDPNYPHQEGAAGSVYPGARVYIEKLYVPPKTSQSTN